MTNLTTMWTATRDDLRARRVHRAETRQLQRELASYSSPSDRAELDAILSRHPADAVAPLEDLINRNRAA
ncbi:hypothetical protein [Aquipuribacter sp. MA13-6]|uniref:hypothetical protein n=1 Tax=unclassified Aquipuribacter TaxID=2635084 RepID=UPI003EE8CB85